MWATSKEGTIVTQFFKMVQKPNGDVGYDQRVPVTNLCNRLDIGFRAGVITERPSHRDIAQVLDGLGFTREPRGLSYADLDYVGGEALRLLAQEHGLVPR